MPVHADAAPVQQQRTSRSVSRCPVNGAVDGRRQRNENDPAAPCPSPEDAVAVFFTQVMNVSTDHLEDPQPEKSQQAHQCEVERVGPTPWRR
jgi:hypothetical protein